ncbi:MAG: homoserine dehydrogenase [Pseudomonadota bacterium]
MKSIKVGLIGLGTVGSGVAQILTEHRRLIADRVGAELLLARVAEKHLDAPRRYQVDRGLMTTDVADILHDPEIDIVVELVGGLEPARTFIVRALEARKHVVTANKALLAHDGNALFALADRMGRELGFEASVCGAIPIIKAVREGLAGNEISYTVGIMNGTANYILSKMTDEGAPYDRALKEAQEKGFAEADPTFDVEGIDTAHKLAILTALCYGNAINLQDIYTEGISRLEPLDIGFAKEFGYRIKLLAISRRNHDSIEARVHPAMIPASHLLANVSGAFNAVEIVADAAGPTMLYGLGAGMLPAGSAVVADIIDIARNMLTGSGCRVPLLAHQPAALRTLPLRPIGEVCCQHYVRFSALDRPGVLSGLAGVLAEHGISIASCVQKGRKENGSVPVVMLTHEAKEADMRRALEGIEGLLGLITAPVVRVRIESLQ